MVTTNAQNTLHFPLPLPADAHDHDGDRASLPKRRLTVFAGLE